MRRRAAAGGYRIAEGKRRSEGVGVEERLAGGVKYCSQFRNAYLAPKQTKINKNTNNDNCNDNYNDDYNDIRKYL